MNDPRRSCRLFSQTQKAVKSPPRELGMTPAAESLAGSSGGQARFIKQLILFTDNFRNSRSVNSLQSCSGKEVEGLYGATEGLSPREDLGTERWCFHRARVRTGTIRPAALLKCAGLESKGKKSEGFWHLLQ